MLGIFNEIGMGRSLLILGAPGCGKTTMLLELACQLIERARQDETEPIPVVFNLASWTEKQTLADWLAEQSNTIYSVPKKIAPAWVNENRMLLLLDGLDEVKTAIREKCVEAINKFKQEHGLTSLVVCSRTADYEELNKQLTFEGAVTIQPLSKEQVFSYFDKFGESLASIMLLFEEDETLRELAETPLMLSIMALAYKGSKPEEILTSENIEEHRKHIFNTYIKRMFERSSRTTKSQFTEKKTLHYLSWLACKIVQNNLITYQIESMQSSWLENENQRNIYRLFVGLLVGLGVGLLAGLRVGLLAGLGVGLLVGQIFGLDIGPANDMTNNLIWDWKLGLRGLLVGLLFALPLGMCYGLILVLYSGAPLGLLAGLTISLPTFLFFGVPVGLLVGLTREQVVEISHPGQRLKQTLYSAILVVISMGLSIGLLIGLYLGLSVGLLFGLNYGILALCQLYVLRHVFVKNDFIPSSFISFLEYSVDLISLRRVGGSYIFIHRTLMEHFAEMELETTTD